MAYWLLIIVGFWTAPLSILVWIITGRAYIIDLLEYLEDQL